MTHIDRCEKFPRVRPHRFVVCALAVFVLSAGLAVAQERDPKAVEITEAMLEKMGGADKWNLIRYVRFEFNVSSEGQARPGRTHLWDKWEGRYRVESQTKDGKQQVVLFNTNTKVGDVYVDGAKVEGDASADALKSAYGAFINDTYCLAMPWKWLDPGVSLKHIGTKEHDGETCDVVELTFDSVGLTPGDTYHGYVSQKTGMMLYWEYTLQSDRTGAWTWEYGNHNGLMLAADHTNAEGRRIHMGDVAVFSEVDDAYFTDAAKGLDGLK